MSNLATAFFCLTLAFGMHSLYAEEHDGLDFDPMSEMPGPTDVEFPVFVTPARMASSAIDSPNSVTSIDATTLKLLGITEMPDAMRLVPGMMISETHGSDVSIGYHGANVNVPRRSEVLYNSNRLYRPGYAGAHWYRLPVDLQDLSFIEIVRGPSSEYGTNAMTSTVNLIQDTITTRGLYASARIGDAETRDAFINGGWVIGESQLGLRFFHRENAGFDDAVGIEEDYQNDVSTNSLMINLEHRLPSGWLIDVAASYADSDYQIPGFNHLEPDDPFFNFALGRVLASPDTDENAGFLSAKLHGVHELGDVSHELTLGLNYSNFSRDQSLSVCANNFAFDPRISEVDTLPNVRLDPNDQFAFVAAIFSGRLTLNSSITGELSDEERATVSALGPYLQQQGLSLLSERCGVSDQDLDENRLEFNALAVSHFSDSLKNSFGVSLTKNAIEAQTYLNGTERQDAYQVYNNLRYSPSDRWVLNGMLSLEGADNVDADAAFSYRFSANYRASDALVLRVMHARAERLPDVYETSRDWTYLTVYDDGEVDHLGRDRGSLLRRAQSPDNLRPEVLENTEIALSYSVFNNVQADVKLFYEDYSDLISEAFNYIDFRLTNRGQLTNQGIEFGIQHTLSNGWRWGSSYTYLDADTDTTFEDSLRPTHSGSLWTIVPVGENTHLAAAYYGASNVAQGSYDRFDLTATHSVRISRTDIDLQLNYRHYPDGINAFTEISSITPNIALVDDEHRLFLTLRASFF